LYGVTAVPAMADTAEPGSTPPQIPGHRLADTGIDGVAGLVAQDIADAADVRLGMAHVPGAEITVDRNAAVVNTALAEGIANRREQLVEAGAAPHRHVEHPAGVSGRGGGEDIGLHGVGDVAEVPAGLAIAIDAHLLA